MTRSSTTPASDERRLAGTDPPARKRLLVVLDPTDPDAANRSLLAEAAAHATGARTELAVLSVTPMADYRSRAQTIAGVRQLDGKYSYDQAVEQSRGVALRLGNEVLAGTDVTFEPLGMVGGVAPCALRVAAALDCDHVFVTGRRRRLRDVVRGAAGPASTLERRFPGHLTVCFDNTPAEADIRDGPARIAGPT